MSLAPFTFSLLLLRLASFTLLTKPPYRDPAVITPALARIATAASCTTYAARVIAMAMGVEMICSTSSRSLASELPSVTCSTTCAAVVTVGTVETTNAGSDPRVGDVDALASCAARAAA